MNPDFEKQLETLFNKALDLGGEDRETFYAALATDDKALAERVRAMVDDFEGMESKLSQGVMPLGALANLAGQAGSLSFLETEDGSDRLNPRPTETMPEQIGPYKVLGKIGEGGMGLVYLVEQQEPKRQLALKLLSQARMTTEMRARFQAEYQTQAMMRHPNIASMHESGVSERGEIFFTMEYVKGWSITEYCREKRLDLEERLRLFMQVCDGITHAHQKSVMHRDLKPTNILVTEESGTAQVKIIDFGIAKMMEDASEREFETRVGALVGTLEYMSSEQLSGSGEVDTRSDVFSLGVVLYEMLCGLLPRRYKRQGNSSAEEVLRYFRKTEASPPSLLVVELPEPKEHLQDMGFDHPQAVLSALRDELDWVPLKAMAMDVDRRYQSPEALKADLQRFLDFEPVHAHPPGFLYRSRKFLRRNLLPVALLSVLFLATLGGVGLLLQSNRALTQAKAETEKNLNRFKATNEFLQEMLSAPDPRNRGVEARVIDVLRESEKRLDALDDGTVSNQELEASIRTTLGKTFNKLGRWHESIEQLERALELQKKLLGENDPQVLTAMHELYEAKVAALMIGEVQPELEALLAKQIQVFGKNHESVVKTLSQLGVVYFYTGALEKSEEVLSQAISTNELLFGLDDCKLVATYSILAYAYLYLADHGQALYFSDKARMLARACNGVDHHYTLIEESRYMSIVLRVHPNPATFKDMYTLEERIANDLGGGSIKGLSFLAILAVHMNDLDRAISWGEIVVSENTGWQTMYRAYLGVAYGLCGVPGASVLFEEAWEGYDIQLSESRSWETFGDLIAFSDYRGPGWDHFVPMILSTRSFSNQSDYEYYMIFARKAAVAYEKRGMPELARQTICAAYGKIDDPLKLSSYQMAFARDLIISQSETLAREVLEELALDGVFPYKNEAQYLLYSEFGIAYDP